MRTQRELLQIPIGYWDLELLMFIVDSERVPFRVEDVYFMTGLSHRCDPINLKGGGQIEGSLTIQEYIDVYYEESTEKVAS